MKNTCIMIVGVGGQGTLLASKIIGQAAISLGADVKISEVHGMAQRGGCVVTYVKYGDKIFSPLIEHGEADFVVSFELLEALRYVKYLKADGQLITNTQKINPVPVILGAEKYNENILEHIEQSGIKCISVDALSLAKSCGSIRCVNLVLLGMLASRCDIPQDVWNDAIKKCVPQSTFDMNLQAFKLGCQYSLV